MEPIISLCIPTNGISEWVKPVLDSIFAQGVDPALFEVVVSDNGKDDQFGAMMKDYIERYPNIVYSRNDAYMFFNQLEALKMASGSYMRFLNHREMLIKGALSKMIEIVRAASEDKPVFYFANGVLKKGLETDSFDEFVCGLGRYASWTSGVGIWKSEYLRIRDRLKPASISPHSCILFSDRKNKHFVINNDVFTEEIPTDQSRKGHYDLFKAFAVEEITVTQNLYIDGDIKADTLKKVIRDYRNFTAELYCDFVMLKRPCSYELGGFNDAMGIYFSKSSVIMKACLVWISRAFDKIKRTFKR